MANFTINQSVDGSYITVRDTRTITTSYVIKVQSSYMTDVTQRTLTLTSDQRGNLATGLVLYPTDFGYTDSVFFDGTYVFKVTKDGGAEETLTKAFMEIVAGQVFVNALNYRMYLDIKEKSAIQEQMRLLNTMGYSAEVGSTTYFEENLQLLQDLL